MTQNELLISIVRIYIMRKKQCNFIRDLLYHYKLYFLIKKIQQYDEYNELKPIPFFVLWEVQYMNPFVIVRHD